MVLELYLYQEKTQEAAGCSERKIKEGKSIKKASHRGVSLGFAKWKNKFASKYSSSLL
jgi:hypothetical protein